MKVRAKVSLLRRARARVVLLDLKAAVSDLLLESLRAIVVEGVGAKSIGGGGWSMAMTS